MIIKENTGTAARRYSRRDCWLGVIPLPEVVFLFIVTVRGHGLVLSIVHLLPLTVDSPFISTVLIIFLTNTFQYVVW